MLSWDYAQILIMNKVQNTKPNLKYMYQKEKVCEKQALELLNNS